MRLPWSPGRSARSVGRAATDVIALVCLAPTDDLHHDKPEARVAARSLKPHEPPVLPIRDAATKVAVTAAVPGCDARPRRVLLDRDRNRCHGSTLWLSGNERPPARELLGLDLRRARLVAASAYE